MDGFRSCVCLCCGKVFFVKRVEYDQIKNFSICDACKMKSNDNIQTNKINSNIKKLADLHEDKSELQSVNMLANIESSLGDQNISINNSQDYFSVIPYEAVKSGWDYASTISAESLGISVGNAYVEAVAEAIQKIDVDMNGYAGKYVGEKAKIDVLGGFVAEEWHTDTFNLNATLKGSKSYAIRGNSNKHASSDITVKIEDGSRIENSLKYYATPKQSAKAQSKNIIEAYHEYCGKSHQKSPISFEQYLERNGYSENSDFYRSVYYEQKRIIPSDQLEDAKKYLKNKINKELQTESPTRVSLREGRKETYAQLNDRITDERGIESIPLTKEQSTLVARRSREGKFDPKDFGIDSERMITKDYIRQQSVKVGVNSAVISLVFQLAPDIYHVFDYLIKNGEIDLEQVKKTGIHALTSSATGFLRGYISCSLTIICKSGKLGNALKNVDPSVIGAITTIFIDTCVNSIKVASGTMSPKQLGTELTKDILVTTASLSTGILGQALLPELPVLGYMLGSFVGSVVAGLSINVGEKVMLSFCVESGFSCFGLVEQDYTIPSEFLKQKGISIKEISQIKIQKKQIQYKQISTIPIKNKELSTINITMLDRGIIGINKVGYVLR